MTEAVIKRRKTHREELSDLKRALNAERKSHEHTLKLFHEFYIETYKTLNDQKEFSIYKHQSFWGQIIKKKSFYNSVVKVRYLILKKIKTAKRSKK